MEQKHESDLLIEKYKDVVQNTDSEPNDVVDTFVAMVASSLETMGSDPQTAAKLLYPITYYANDLLHHFEAKVAMVILKEKLKNLKINECPK